MADPLSATGSAIAIIGLAVQSSEILCRFFRSFHEISDDLRHHIGTLEALKAIFARLSDLEKESVGHDLLRQACSSRLKECLLDLKAMEEFVRPLHDELQHGKARKAWTKTKWAGVHQKQKIERFMARMASYCMTFSLDLLLINT